MKIEFKKGDIVFCNGDLEGTDYKMDNTVGVVVEQYGEGVYRLKLPYITGGLKNTWLVYEDQMTLQGPVQ